MQTVKPPRTVLSIDVALKTLAFAIVRFDEGGTTNLHAMDHVDLLALAGEKGKVTATSGEDLVVVVERTMPTLLSLWIPHGIDEVVIERQPATNAKMRMVACTIATYLRTTWALWAAFTDTSCRVPLVYFQAPTLQRIAYPSSVEQQKGAETASKRYAAKKADAVAAARAIFRTYTEWPPCYSEAFELAKKKDDLADALLQAFAWNELRTGTGTDAPALAPLPERVLSRLAAYADEMPKRSAKPARKLPARGKKRKRAEA